MDGCFVVIRNEQAVLDRDAAALYGVDMDDIIKVVRCNPERFPSGFIIELTEEEKQEVDAISSSYAFTETGMLMLATLVDSTEAYNVVHEIIETFTEYQQFIRRTMKGDGEVFKDKI